jgi:hypothetical protein
MHPLILDATQMPRSQSCAIEHCRRLRKLGYQVTDMVVRTPDNPHASLDQPSVQPKCLISLLFF